jgi:hypothetical protein
MSLSFIVPHAEAENLEMSLQISKEIIQDKSIEHLVHKHQHGKRKGKERYNRHNGT